MHSSLEMSVTLDPSVPGDVIESSNENVSSSSWATPSTMNANVTELFRSSWALSTGRNIPTAVVSLKSVVS